MTQVHLPGPSVIREGCGGRARRVVEGLGIRHAPGIGELLVRSTRADGDAALSQRRAVGEGGQPAVL
jgi:hypothetical protein